MFRLLLRDNTGLSSCDARWKSVCGITPWCHRCQRHQHRSRPQFPGDLIVRLGKGSLRWHMIVTLAEPGDPVDDATRTWPAGRSTIDVGTLTLVRTSTEETGLCRDITFDPTILPSGVAPSDDPLLAARSAVYAASLARRDGEPAQPSALSVDPLVRRTTP